ncbi:MAG: radical SAM protein [Pseudomonadota bacterium]
MRFFSGTFRKARFQQLYLGGGTVNLLNKVQLNKIMTHVYKFFNFIKNTRKSIECNPDIAKESHMRQLRQMGFNRMNFGVQSLTRKALKINNRSYQTYAKVKDAILFAKKHGFTDIGIDLMAGLAGDSLDDFAKSFAKIAKLKPANIIVYVLRPPDKKYLSRLLKISEKNILSNAGQK